LAERVHHLLRLSCIVLVLESGSGGDRVDDDQHEIAAKLLAHPGRRFVGARDQTFGTVPQQRGLQIDPGERGLRTLSDRQLELVADRRIKTEFDAPGPFRCNEQQPAVALDPVVNELIDVLKDDAGGEIARKEDFPRRPLASDQNRAGFRQ